MRGRPSHERDNYRHNDQGLYAGNGNAENRALRLELGLLAGHGLPHAIVLPDIVTQEPGCSFRLIGLKMY